MNLHPPSLSSSPSLLPSITSCFLCVSSLLYHIRPLNDTFSHRTSQDEVEEPCFPFPYPPIPLQDPCTCMLMCSCSVSPSMCDFSFPSFFLPSFGCPPSSHLFLSSLLITSSPLRAYPHSHQQASAFMSHIDQTTGFIC